MKKKKKTIKKSLMNIENRLRNIESLLEDIKTSNLKIDNHVDFVDAVFETLKKPFNNLLSIYTGNDVNIDKNKIEYKKDTQSDK